MSKKEFWIIFFVSSIALFLLTNNDDKNKLEAYENTDLLTSKNEKISLGHNSKNVEKENNASLERVISLREEWAQYPPNSRPLDEGAVDLINPDIVEDPFSIARRVNDAGDIVGSPYRCQLQPKKHTILPTDKRQVFSFFCIDDANQSVLMNIESIKAELSNAEGIISIKPSRFIYQEKTIINELGQSFSGYDITFKPKPQEWGDVRLRVNYFYSDRKEELFFSQKIFNLSNIEAGAFLDEYKERVEDGSLIVYAYVDIYEEGWYQFNANLRNEEGYIAAATHEAMLSLGKHAIPFLFFGKIIHDKKANGPYVVTGVRGRLISGPLDHALTLPPEEFEQALAGADYDRPTVIPIAVAKDYLTDYYNYDVFSIEPYSSLENDKYMEMLHMTSEDAIR